MSDTFTISVRVGEETVTISHAFLEGHSIDLNNLRDRELIAATVSVWAQQLSRDDELGGDDS